MTIIFKAKTPEAYVIKITAELLSSILKDACFIIDNEGITLTMMDNHRTILVSLCLQAKNFSLYKFNSKKLYVGITLNHFHKMLKSIKKKDQLELFIDDINSNELGIKVTPKDQSRVTTSFITIKNIQNIEIDMPKNNINL
jgi:DNA polymerase III sliding clamp (beta) subunit (PCNA family)